MQQLKLFLLLIVFLFSTVNISQAQTSLDVTNKTTGDTLLSIDNIGRVGIGLTNPLATLDVQSSGSGVWWRGFRVLNPDQAVGDRFMLSLGKDDNPFNIGQMYFRYFGDGLTNNYLSLGLYGVADVLNITGSGNVGIGTTTPLTKLEVADTIFSSFGGFMFPDSTVQTTAATSGTSIWQQNGSNVYYNTGNVGVGTSSPLYPMSIDPGTNTRGIFIDHDQTGSGATYGVYVDLDNTNAGNFQNYGVLANATSNAGTSPNMGLYGRADGTASGDKYGTYGYASGLGSNLYGLYGRAYNTSGTASQFGVYGVSDGTDSGMHCGVYGSASGNGTNWAGYFSGGNVYIANKLGMGTSNPLSTLSVGADGITEATISTENASVGGRGIYGYATDTGTTLNYGGWFESEGTNGRGALGMAHGSSSIGVKGSSDGSDGIGVNGWASGSDGRGVVGQATATGDVTNYGGYFSAGGETGIGVYGIATNSSYGTTYYNYGGYFVANNTYGRGVLGEGPVSGVYGRGPYQGVAGYITDGSGEAIYGNVGSSTGDYAGYFNGNVECTGGYTKSFSLNKIDHPLDPENKYLYHSSVESSDMMNVYNGNVLLDSNGEAWVDLPGWFEALNKEFRYQLTCIGGFAQVYIAEEVQNNRFKISGDKPGMKISWQITGIRKDKLAEQFRIVVEKDKPNEERGKYLHPQAFGLDESRGIGYEENKMLNAEHKNFINQHEENL